MPPIPTGAGVSLGSRVFGWFSGIASGQSAGNVTDSVFELARQNAWVRRAYALLDPTAAASADAAHLHEDQDFRSYDGAGHVEQQSHWEATAVDLRDDALRNGVGNPRFNLYAQLARTVPTLSEVLDLWRRGFTDEATVNSVLRRMGYVDGVRPALKRLRYVLPSVTDMVRFAVREVYNPSQRQFLDLDAEFPEAFADDADRIGLARQTAKDYWAAHWELPSYEQLNEMLFRKVLTREEYQDALKAIDYAPTWRGKLETIARRIPTITDMVRFAVREVYNPPLRQELGYEAEYPEAFTAQAALHGMSEQHAKEYWWAHWRLPSATQGYEMLHRGEIDVTELNQLLKALDYPQKWRPRLRNIAYRVPGRVDLRRMFAADVIDRARVKRGYLDLGYNEQDAETLTDFAVKLAAQGSAGAGQSYTQRAQTQLWSRTHSSYLAAEISEAEAREKLPLAGVPASEVEAVLTIWNDEREVERKQLTPAQIKKAWQKAVQNPTTGAPWTQDEALAALIGRGYSPADAQTFLTLP